MARTFPEVAKHILNLTAKGLHLFYIFIIASEELLFKIIDDGVRTGEMSQFFQNTYSSKNILK